MIQIRSWNSPQASCAGVCVSVWDALHRTWDSTRVPPSLSVAVCSWTADVRTCARGGPSLKCICVNDSGLV